MKTRKGFTMVELLIAIIIIAILAAAMLLSSRSLTAAADASVIIYNLRDLKTACMLLYAASGDLAPGTADISMLTSFMVDPELFGVNPSNAVGPYMFEVDDVGNWWVGYNLTAGNKGPDVGEKLIGKAKSIGLYKDHAYNYINNKVTDRQVWLLVARRSF